MALFGWLPIGFMLPDMKETRAALFGGSNWQIFGTSDGGRSLVVKDDIFTRWVSDKIIDEGWFTPLYIGGEQSWLISCDHKHLLSPVNEAECPNNKMEAMAFAQAMKITREIDSRTGLQDAIYIEKISRLLPTYTLSPLTGDDLVLGYWLTGGALISVTSFRRLKQIMSWLGDNQLRQIIDASGIIMEHSDNISRSLEADENIEVIKQEGIHTEKKSQFELAGRPELATFINEHIVDIVENRDRYKSFGINYPSAVILHGPPGCGKTFAVEKLVDFLKWPSFQIDASSVASQYIHETSRKVAEVFNKAIESSPSVIIIDEMEAFLSERDVASGHHRVEEVAEFLRRIPEALKNDVLIIAMTNRIDMIDPAILRRGRFDHIIAVDYASLADVQSLLEKLLSSLPIDEDVDIFPVANALSGRPLSDVSFVVREGARLAARSGKSKIDQMSLLSALSATSSRTTETDNPKIRMGFI